MVQCFEARHPISAIGDLTNRPSVVDVVLTFDAAAVGNMSVLRAAVRRLMAYAEAGIVW